MHYRLTGGRSKFYYDWYFCHGLRIRQALKNLAFPLRVRVKAKIMH